MLRNVTRYLLFILTTSLFFGGALNATGEQQTTQVAAVQVTAEAPFVSAPSLQAQLDDQVDDDDLFDEDLSRGMEQGLELTLSEKLAAAWGLAREYARERGEPVLKHFNEFKSFYITCLIAAGVAMAGQLIPKEKNDEQQGNPQEDE